MAELKEIESGDAWSHVGLIGRLDIEGVMSVELKFTASTTTRRKPAIVDLSEVEFITSLGIGMLIRVAHALKEQGSKMVLLDPSPLVGEILRVTSIEAVLPIAESREQALEMLGVA